MLQKLFITLTKVLTKQCRTININNKMFLETLTTK